MITANPLLGTFLHAIGAIFAATCYTPQKRVKRWSWQTYWLVQASFCWLILPIVGAMLTIPHLRAVLAEAPRDAMVSSFVLGAAYGIGGTAFGIAIRYIGFSLTYAIAVGLSSVLGTLIPTWVGGMKECMSQPGPHNVLQVIQAGGQSLTDVFSKVGGGYVETGIIIGALGIGLCGVAGRMKELNLRSDSGSKDFNLTKGLLLSLLAGVLSAVYGFALEAGKPIAEVAVKHGAGIWQGNVTYIFSNTGAFLTTAIYCLYLHFKHKTLGEIVELPAGPEEAKLPVNFLMAFLTGLFWYCQFFFYNLGHVRMGEYKFSSWAIHMIMLVLFSNVVGIALREWSGCRFITRLGLIVALSVLVGAVLLLTYGNYVGEISVIQ